MKTKSPVEGCGLGKVQKWPIYSENKQERIIHCGIAIHKKGGFASLWSVWHVSCPSSLKMKMKCYQKIMPWAIGCIFVDLGKHKPPCYYCFLYTGKNTGSWVRVSLCFSCLRSIKVKPCETSKNFHSLVILLMSIFMTGMRKKKIFLGTHIYNCYFSYLPNFYQIWL